MINNKIKYIIAGTYEPVINISFEYVYKKFIKFVIRAKIYVLKFILGSQRTVII